MAAESGADVHHGGPRSLLGLFDVAATGLADWSEFDAEAERLRASRSVESPAKT
jgi:hypothetical protein